MKTEVYAMKKYEFKSVTELPAINELPDVLDGITAKEDWPRHREYIKAMLAHYMLGHRPENDSPATGEVLSENAVYCGKAIRSEVRLNIGNGESFDCYVVRPNRPGRFPAVVWTYFAGFGECPMGEELVDRGYVLAAFENNAVCRDDAKNPDSPAKRAYPKADWAAIMIWGWGFSKVADYLTTLDFVDGDKLMCTGHSRNGKAAIAAGAYDERFKVVAPINSGCGGCGCFRFLGDEKEIIQDPEKVESLGRITHTFPHWFAPELMSFGGDEAPYPIANENRLPFELHFIKALIAPRGLITVEGTEDIWSNPYGTYLTRLAAQKAFDLTGASGRNMQIIRDGGHAHTARDWRWTIDFADAVFAGKL